MTFISPAEDFPNATFNTLRRLLAGKSPIAAKAQDNVKDLPMIQSVRIGSTIIAQGPVLQRFRDGRIAIDAGGRRVVGEPIQPYARAEAQVEPHLAASAISSSFMGFRLGLFAAGAALAGLLASATLAQAQDKLLNVSYDPTRELYREFNEVFADYWEAQGNPRPLIEQSHGGSGAQARSVIDGLGADVVTLALASDIDAIVEKTDLIPEDWQARLPHNSSPYTSTIVFLVREGNPKGIKDWDDLVKDGVEVITPNPKTSGGARWNYLAAWAWAEANGKDPKEFVGELFKHVPVLDSGARGSTTTFAQRGIGDVLLAWENEAYLALAELGEGEFDIVAPSVSILAEPPVAIVDGNIANDEERKLAEAYLNFLYSPEGQAVAYKNFYRGWDSSKAAPEDVARFPDLKLVTIADFGGWKKAQPEHFGDGGIFDQIYVPK